MKACVIIKAGLIAGIIICLSAVTMVPVVGSQMDLALAKFNLPPLSTGAMIFFCFVSLSLGITLIWLYAAILPRFEHRIKSAIIASFVLWFPGYLLPNLANVAYGFMPVELTVIGIVWGLGELLIAGLIGTMFYKEANIQRQ